MLKRQYMEHYRENSDTILQNLGSSASGLLDDECQKRLLAYGKNELTTAKRKGWLRRFANQLMNPMLLILIAASIVSLGIAILGKGGFHDYADSIVIIVVVILNCVLGLLQENKAEKAIEALRKLGAATAKTRRNHIVSIIPASEIVIGDIILLEAGDAVPADMRLIYDANLQIEESSLTGESVPSTKNSQPIAVNTNETIPLGDRKNMAYMGSNVTYGRGEGVVTATGMKTEMGKIAHVIETTKEGQTPLQKRLSKLSKTLSVVVLFICAIVFAVRVLGAEELNLTIFMDSFMLAVALAVAAIPEGLAAVITIVLSIGVANMAKRKAIVRRLTAVETLGCAQVICSDKTGTLTQNKMTVMDSFGDSELLAKGMALCCDSQLSPGGEIVGDPTENALIAFALQEGLDANALSRQYPRVAEAPFDSSRKMMSTVHKETNGYIQFTKGAPDEVMRRCTKAIVNGNEIPLSPEVFQNVMSANTMFTDKAYRVLACAQKTHDTLPSDLSPDNLERDMTFVGLEALIDPVRPEAKDALKECESAGIKVVLITGDHKGTAVAIAKELGILTDSGQAISGQDLETLPDIEFEKKIESITVYARVQPEHKTRIVNMWKQRGYVTAMTGDGVNDAAAIKAGDIGIGMGISGTDVTKNVADMVLADDNFATIVAAVGEGRRIYENIKKTLQFLLSTNLSEVISILLATLLGFVLLKPVHLLFINLITDTLPAVALGMEQAEDDIMKRPPRGAKEGLLSKGLVINIVYQGLLIAAITLGAYFIVNSLSGHEYAMTSAFFTLTMCEVFQSLTMRSLHANIFTMKTKNKFLLGAMAFSVVTSLALIYVPFLADVFSLVPLSPLELIISILLAFIVVPVIEGVKAVQRNIPMAKQNNRY